MPHLVTEAPPSLTTEASNSREGGEGDVSSSVATETPFLVTEVSGSLATKALPALETSAPSSLATEGPSSKATKAPPSLTTEVYSTLETHSLLSYETPATSPKPTHGHIPKWADKEVSSTEMSSRSQKRSLHPDLSLTVTQEKLPDSQEASEAELSSSSEELASVQDKPSERQAAFDHKGHTLSKSHSNFPNVSAFIKTLAWQSSLPGKICNIRPPFPPDCQQPAPSTGVMSMVGHTPLNRSFLPGCCPPPLACFVGWVGGQ